MTNMPKQKIFPDNIINQSSEQLIYDYSKKSNAIYLILLVTVILLMASSFFIKVDIGVNTTGIIKPKGERSIITASIGGRIVSFNIKENGFVNRGDTLLVISADLINSQLPSLNQRQSELRTWINDLRYLLSSDSNEIGRITSREYVQQYTLYKSELRELELKEELLRKSYTRDKQLLDTYVIARAEFERTEADYNNILAAIATHKNNTMYKWEAARSEYLKELRDIEARVSQISIQEKESIVIATVSGTIQKVLNIDSGTFVQAGQEIAEISPEGALLAECYISPKDIGLIRPGLKGRIQVTAFNYNDWGVLETEIMEIYDDIVVSDGVSETSFYRVYCSLSSDHLSLKNGSKGYIKKGMSINARFIITSRTLFQLLYDKVDDWLNPAIDN